MKIYLKVFAVLLSAPLAFASATGDATLSVNSIINVNGYNWTVTGSDAVLDSITVNAASFSLTMSAGQTLKLTSADRVTLSVPQAASIQTGATCNSSESTYTITNPSGGATATFTVDANTTACVVSGGGGGASGGGGGGGGGGSSAPAIPAQTGVPAPVPTAQPSTVAQAVSPVFNRNLAPGTKNNDVKRLQQLLAQDKSIYPEGQTTGYFGPATKKALIKFQLRYSIIKKATDAGSGNLGPKTRAKIKEVFGGSAVSAPAAAPTTTPIPTPAPAPVPAPTPTPAPPPAGGSSGVPWFLQLSPAPHAQ